ncbi:D-alanine-D-alanine ligase [Actinoplanes octamycinicus]|uniref:D-alanine--D-alanine ligase n=1 Tax=Actinoplanes octamycinicus TaxID=135948 RepID=A0A7W7M5R4_9ACTN|nr:D-alanine--D-alanine ligase family protein [Actinoplanes octamycinicus]MBB4737956.1 D-alanine-D-alanine ligase [Actinoplanes octamycinicus]GIE58993.1 D-alanine--D-alanine ligase [Actinoplanes octamycinicus]
MQNSRTRVAVIFGGQSAEHDVSCRSAASVFRFLDRGRYDVLPIRISRAGVWEIGTDTGTGAEFPARPARSGSLIAALGALRSVDVAFPVMHGPFGEDGTLQAVLETAGVRYVGSGVLASATSMDKQFTKTIVAAEGIAVADGVVLRAGDDDVSAADRARLGLPVFVKPARSGSSVGVTRVDDWADLEQAIVLARKHDTKVLVEAAVLGREVDMAVLEHPDGTLEAGPALEIRHGAAFFDFDAKYTPGAAEFVIPAELRPDQRELLAETAIRAFRALGCGGLLRVDFFLTDDGVVLNEVNTLPGLTELSQFPQIWRAAGRTYPELLDLLLRAAR